MGRTGAVALAKYLSSLPNIQRYGRHVFKVAYRLIVIMYAYHRLNISHMSLGDTNIRIFFNVLTAVGLGSVVDEIPDIECLDDNLLSEAMCNYEQQFENGSISKSSSGDASCDSSDLGSLRSLRVSNNKIEESGAKAIARFLQYGGDGLAEV